MGRDIRNSPKEFGIGDRYKIASDDGLYHSP
jgi:hypothetical protein